MKISPVGAELFHADRQTQRQTDMTKLIVVLSNFANSRKNQGNCFVADGGNKGKLTNSVTKPAALIYAMQGNS
jgi:hypothetical protein